MIKNKTSNTKRKTGLYLAVIMLFNLIVPFSTPAILPVQAVALIPDFIVIEQGMATNPYGSTPITVGHANASTATNRTNNHVYMSFPAIPADPNNSFIIRYALADGREVNLEIRIVNDVATVRYILPPPVATPNLNPNFSVWLAPMERDFILIDEYINRTDRPNHTGIYAHRVVGRGFERLHPMAPPATPIPPGWPDPATWPIQGENWWITAGVTAPPNWVSTPGALPGIIAERPFVVWPPSFGATVPIQQALISQWVDLGWQPFVHSHYEVLMPPTFEMSRGTGFSFRYFGDYVHIRFDEDNNFHFAVDHFSHGFIHDVVLEELNVADVVVRRSGLFINTGLTGPGGRVRITPFANAPMPAGLNDGSGDRVNEPWDYINRIAYPRYYPAYPTRFEAPRVGFPDSPTVYEGPTRGVTPPDAVSRWPAMPEEALGLRLSFYTPRFLPTQASGSAEPTSIAAIVDFQGANTFQIVLNNVVRGVTPGLLGGNPPGIHVRPITTSAAGLDFDEITMDILVRDAAAIGQDLFRPGIFFTTGSYVGLVPQPRVGTISELFARASSIGIPNPVPGSTEVFGAFTLPHYEITMMNGIYHIDIATPFAQRGEYVILESPLPGTPQLGDITLSRTGVIEPGQVIAPIPLRGDAFTSARFVQIFFRPGDYFSEADLNFVRQGIWPIRSQAIWFRGHPDDIGLRTSEHFSAVLNSHIPKDGDLTRHTGTADITLTWQIGRDAIMDHFFSQAYNVGRQDFDIYYQFNWSTNPYDIYPDEFVQIRVNIRPGATPGALEASYHIVRRVGDPTSPILDEDLLYIEGIQLISGTSPLINSPTYGFMGSVRLHVDTYHMIPFSHVAPPRGLSFPGIHFLNVQPVQVMDSTEFHTPASGYDGFTLSDFDDYEVPPPQNLRAYNEVSLNRVLNDPHDQISFDVSWDIHLPQIREYLLMTYGLLYGTGNRFRLDMNLYISQDEYLMRNEFSDTNHSNQRDVIVGNSLIKRDRHIQRAEIVDMVIDAQDHPLDDVSGVLDGDVIFFSEIRGNEPTGDDAKDILRDYGIVAVTNLPIDQDIWDRINDPTIDSSDASRQILPVHFTLDGLDRNQQYFVFVDFILTQIPAPPGITHGALQLGGITPFVDIDQPGFITRIIDSSMLSNMDGVTIPDDREVPDGIDRDPMAPVINVDRDATGLNTATIYWNRIVPLAIRYGYTETLEYEIIRTRDHQLRSDPDELLAILNSRVPFEQVWDALDGHEDIVAFRTTGSGIGYPATEVFGLRGRPDAPRDEFVTIEETYPIFGADPVRFRDDGLRSNSLYFYYVRTIRTVSGPTGTWVTFSTWSHETVTTTIAGAPRNLRIEHGPEREYDRLHEVMISFEAPIRYSAEFLADALGRDFILEYQLRIDDGEWMTPNRMGEAFLRQHARAAAEVGWTWFLYHIFELHAGQNYTVRVRMVELDEAGERLSESIWSNEAHFITDLDPDLEEEERLERDWIDYLRRRLEELLRNPYWIIRDDASAFHIIYRNAMFNDIVARASGGHIHLPVRNARQTTYYIPIHSFTQAWDRELAFVLNNTYGNMSIMIPARAIDLHNNDQVVDLGVAIRRREFQDYMVRFNVDWSSPPDIQGEETFTHVADIHADLVSTQTNIGTWETNLAGSLITRVDEMVSDPETIAFIRTAIREQMPEEDISRRMVEIVENAARQSLARIVNDNFRTLNVRNRVWNIPRLDRSMAVSAIGSDSPFAAVSAHQSTGANLWNNVATMQVGDLVGIFTPQPGVFVFTGRLVQIQGIEQVEGGPVATGVVARHGLDDFFGRGDMNVAEIATRSQLVNSVARMMGAPRGTDAVPWLRSQGVNVAAAGMNNPISNQAALHLIMMVYEAQTGTRADSIRITNFAAVNNIAGLQPQYRTSVAAAIELGLVDAASLQAEARITVGALLEVLAALDRRIGL